MRRSLSGILSLSLLLIAMVPAPASGVDWTCLYVLMAGIEGSLETKAGEAVAEESAAEAPSSDPEAAGSVADEGDLSWAEIKARFDRVCGKIQVAPDLPVEEVEGLIEECKLLRRALERSDNPQAKVLLKRLKMCQDFFEYSLEVR